jgi:hypothetical protein
MPDPITALRRARDLLAEQGDADVVPVVWAIDGWIARGGDFAAALGMAPGWHSAARIRQRDAALRKLAAQYAPLRGRRLAAALVADAKRYETTRWPGDCADQRRPDGLQGLFYDLLSHGPMPAEETLRKCIG